MGRLALLTLCALSAAGCASPIQFMPLAVSDAPESDAAPEPGQWCIVQLKTEHLDPQTQEWRFLWGRVEHIDDDTLRLADVMEEKRLITAQPLWRKIPYVSRLMTSVTSEVELLETREIPRPQITWLNVVPEKRVEHMRQQLISVGDKWIFAPQGVDFDFVIPTQ